MLKGQNIICISSTDWDGVWGSRQQIMLRLAKENRVLYVEGQVGPEQLLIRRRWLWKAKLRRWREGLKKIKGNLWIWSPPLVPPGRYYSLLANRLGQWLISLYLRRLAQDLDFSDPILWIYPPQCGDLIGRFNEKLAIYHCIDEAAGGISGRKRRVIQQEEGVLLEKADVIFVHSRGLLESKSGFNPNIYLIPSAADIDHFAKVQEENTPIHPDIKRLQRPVIGQVGNFDARSDVELITYLATTHPEWSIAIVGLVQEERVDVSALKKLQNVHFLGKRHFQELPSLIKGMDVCIIPYVVSEMTIYINPLKLYEYMAAGKPIVSTDLPEVRPFYEVVTIARTPEEFAQGIAAALANDSPTQVQRRMAIARQHSWDQRVEAMSKIIMQTLSAKGSE